MRRSGTLYASACGAPCPYRGAAPSKPLDPFLSFRFAHRHIGITLMQPENPIVPGGGNAMARHRGSKRNRQARNAGARRSRAVGLGSSAGAFLAFGLSPLANTPMANADGLDVIIDPIINSISSSLGGVADPLAALDLGTVASSAADAAGTSDLGLGSLDSALTSPSDWLAALGWSSEPAATALPADAVAATSALPDASTSDPAQLFNADIFQPLETVEQDWINSSFGEFVDNSLNTLYQDLGGQGMLIGEGANGVGGGRWLAADGQAGGLLFGDGGNGATDLLGQGGAGGAAYDGDGGDGGVGIDGGSGGDGGN